MESKKSKLMEMVETVNGYEFNDLTLFFLNNHVNEIIEKTKEALLVYTEMDKIVSSPSFKDIADIRPDELEILIERLKAELGISVETVTYIVNWDYHDFFTLFEDRYTPLIEMYQGLVKALEDFSEKQKEVGTQQNTD